MKFEKLSKPGRERGGNEMTDERTQSLSTEGSGAFEEESQPSSGDTILPAVVIEDHPFKNASGIWLTKALFFETSFPSERSKTYYTLKDEDISRGGKTYLSLRRLYLSEGDESEYSVAIKYFGGWSHWKKLCDSEFFKGYLQEFREELQALLLSQRLKALNLKASSGDPRTNQYLLDRQAKELNKVGRPSKSQILRRAQELVQDHRIVDEDFGRINLLKQ